MSALSVEVPFPVFYDRSGEPLENGYVWIGQANLNPQTNPIQVYFDKNLTQPAAQPLRTLAGYIANAGTPAQIYVDAANYSILVQDKNGTMVYNFPDGTGVDANLNACAVEYDPPFTNAVQTTVCEKLADTVSVKDFGAVGDGVTDDTAAIQAAVDSIDGATSRVLYFPAGNYRLTNTVETKSTLTGGAVFFGEGGFSGNGSSIFVDFDGVGFLNISASVQFKNLSFQGIRGGSSVGLRNAKTGNTDDMDTWVTECTFNNFNTCIQHVGRGLLCTDNTFAVSDLAIDISWPTGGTEGGGVQALPYGMRKWMIVGNFFHSLGNAIAITGANAEYFRAATIVGNIMDIGRQFFSGPISFSTISGNSIQNANSTPISISQVCENVIISGNSIGGYEGTDTGVFTPAGAINFAAGTVIKNVSITGNDFQYTDSSAVRVQSDMESCVISSNSIDNYNLDAGTAYGIFVTGNLTRCAITGNAFGTNPGSTRAIRVQGTATYCTVTDNTWDVSQGNLSNIDTLVQSIVQGSEVYLHLNDLGVQDSVNAELQISSTKNDSSWNTATDNFGELAVYSADVSGSGAGKRATLRAKTSSGVGSNTFWQFSVASTTVKDVAVLNVTSSALLPEVDGSYDLGSGSNRYQTVYATTPAINTSDENEKQDIGRLSERELRVAKSLKQIIKTFRFKDAVSTKGNEARLHFGVIAQDVEFAFLSEGLDPTRYGVFCKDEWYELDGKVVEADENGEYPDGSVKRTRLGVRYEELFALVIAGL
jgi:hypothetical protein